MKNALERLLLGLIGGLFRILPRGWTLLVGRSLGILGYYLAGKRRRTALSNLEAAYGREKGRREKITIARKSFGHLGMTGAEFFLIPFLDENALEGILSFSGEHHLKAALSRGRGVLLLSGHLGNWELLAAALARKGYPTAVIAKTPKKDAVNLLLTGHRESAGIKVLKGRGLLRDTMKHLDTGGIVGFVLDQNARRSEGVFVPFFGREACTLKSLALIARRTGAPVVPACIYRQENRHIAVIEEPLTPHATDDLDTDILGRTQQYTAWIEKAIRLHPEQWTWLHDRWRTRRKSGNEE